MTKFPKLFHKIAETPSFLSLYRFASGWDITLLLFGVLFTLIKACLLPILTAIYSEASTLLVERNGNGTITPTVLLKWFGGGNIITNATVEENISEIMNDWNAFFLVIMIGSLVHLISGIICVDFFNRAALNQVTRIRIAYFTSLMQQDIGWYDIEKGKSNFTVRLADDIDKIKNGIGEQVSHALALITGCVLAVITSLIFGWELTLVIVSYIPLLIVMNLFVAKFQAKLSTKELNAYAIAANVVEEVLSGIRTVLAFGGEKVEVERYKNRLLAAERAVKQKSVFACIGDAITRFLFFAACAFSFWIGVHWVLDDREKVEKTYTAAVLIIVFNNLINGAEHLARLPPFLEIFSSARGAAKNVFAIIDNKSNINPMDTHGKVLNLSGLNGDIEYKDIVFKYPSRPDVPILNGLNLKIEGGQTVALVGNSGNGKSTCLHLLERFYDPDRGAVLIDGCDIRELNLNSLRSSIAVVGQEPVLFSVTIGENIRYGHPSATDEEIVAAARMSGAHDFIAQLPQGYSTMMGELGSQFSGGQRQRIAIARALIQNPKILLLDEATSALDYHSEKQVQETLDRVSKGRTTLVISHRMSAVRNADRILFIDKGKVVEDGTHSELIASKGRYYEMVKSTHDEFERSDEVQIEEKQICDENGNVSGIKYHENASDEIVGKKGKSQETDSIMYWKSFKRMLQLLKPDWIIITIAIFSSIVLGFTLPLFATLFSEVFVTFAIADRAEASRAILQICLVFLALGVLMFTMAITQTWFFAKAGAKITQRVRLMTFAAMLRQECGWFDKDEHSVGILSSYLSSDAANIQTAIGFPLSVILQSISTVVLGMIISLFASTTLTIVCLSSLIILLPIVFLEARNTSNTELIEKDAIAMGMKIATEAITNIRTVASLRQEKPTISRFISEMENVLRIARKKIIWRGLLNSTIQTIPMFAYGYSFYFGSYLVSNGEIHYKYVIRVCESLLFGVFIMSETLVFATSISTAFAGAHRLFKIVDRVPMIESPHIANENRKADQRNFIKFKHIDFRYPTRPEAQILNNFCLNIEEGKTVALVGPSGCGKSTCIQLLQRLYDPEHGRIRIGLDEISNDITLLDLRSKISIVSQEPTLFDRTIAENIAYGDCSRKVTMNEIIDAAKIANAHNFIVQLPQGYDTNAGSRATQLSGGQKQRIAIARALIRKPKILLLDEATSALDLHSEKIVQMALDSARSGRTVIIIAHRLTTIQNADVICVLQNGRIIESGAHNELLAMNGTYTRLYNAQK